MSPLTRFPLLNSAIPDSAGAPLSQKMRLFYAQQNLFRSCGAVGSSLNPRVPFIATVFPIAPFAVLDVLEA